MNREEPLSNAGVNRDPETPPVPIRKRRTIIALDGDVLTDEELIVKMRQNSTPEKQPRGRPKKSGRKAAKTTAISTPYDDDEESEFEGETTDEE